MNVLTLDRIRLLRNPFPISVASPSIFLRGLEFKSSPLDDKID